MGARSNERSDGRALFVWDYDDSNDDDVMWYCAAAERAGKHTEQAGALRSKFSLLVHSFSHRQ